MYNRNLLLRNVLITPEEVLFHGPTNHTFDIRNIENSIIVAEERFIRPALGYDFYSALKTAKNKEITSDNQATEQVNYNSTLPSGAEAYTLIVGDVLNSYNYLAADDQILWKEHLWKLTAECVIMLAVPEGFVQFSAEGIIHKQPKSSQMITSGSVSPELSSVKWAMDKKMQDRIDPLREAMHLWLCKQKQATPSKYTLYDKTCDCNADGVAYKRKTDLILSIYDEDENCGCY